MGKGKSWKKVSGGNLFLFEKEGDTLIGKYIGVETGQGKYENSLYQIQLEDTKDIKSFFGSAVIDRLMAQVKPGQEIKLVYIGKVKTSSGRKAKNYELFIAE